jgi:hypothetical protein
MPRGVEMNDSLVIYVAVMMKLGVTVPTKRPWLGNQTR